MYENFIVDSVQINKYMLVCSYCVSGPVKIAVALQRKHCFMPLPHPPST